MFNCSLEEHAISSHMCSIYSSSFQLTSVKIWIQLNIPRIEDGNNFGVGVQEESINEIARSVHFPEFVQ
jgi:hypothetical protein